MLDEKLLALFGGLPLADLAFVELYRFAYPFDRTDYAIYGSVAANQLLYIIADHIWLGLTSVEWIVTVLTARYVIRTRRHTRERAKNG